MLSKTGRGTWQQNSSNLGKRNSPRGDRVPRITRDLRATVSRAGASCRFQQGPTPEWDGPGHFGHDFTSIGIGAGVISGSLEVSTAVGFGLGLTMIAAAWGAKNKQAQELQRLAATTQQHLEHLEERELDAAAKLRDEEAQILISTRDQEIKSASEKYDPRVEKLETQLAESQAKFKKQQDLDQKDFADALAGVSGPPRTRTGIPQ